MIDKRLYNYKVKEVVKIVDGDTFDATIDLGFNVCVKKRIRMHGINTPECRTRDLKVKKKGLQAKKRLEEYLWGYKTESVFIESHGNGKYGRLIARVFVGEENRAKKDIATLMIMEGHGVEYDGGRK